MQDNRWYTAHYIEADNEVVFTDAQFQVMKRGNKITVEGLEADLGHFLWETDKLAPREAVIIAWEIAALMRRAEE